MTRVGSYQIKILLQTKFYPDVGGIEVLSELLATEWMRCGHEVTVLSTTPLGIAKPLVVPFATFYNQRAPAILQLARQHDLVVSMNVSLRCNLPSLLSLKPHVMVHQSCYMTLPDTRRPFIETIKLLIAQRLCHNISASQFIAQRTGITSTIISNPYNAQLFVRRPDKELQRQIVFVGRLVSDKGVLLLLEAVRILRDRTGRCPATTIIGDGPERADLEHFCDASRLTDVRFLGRLSQVDIAAQLQIHRLMAVPSIWEEPFGIVALEGIACGCFVVASNGGGLPEAVGPCGSLFERGNASSLADALQAVMESCSSVDEAKRVQHLHQHTLPVVAKSYLKAFEAFVSQ